MPLFAVILALSGGTILLALAIFIRVFLVVATVHGHSMSPTLEQNDRVLALRLFPRRWIRKGHIVLVWSSSDAQMPNIASVVSYIKRVVAMEGEDAPALSGKQALPIPQGHVFVCGDNREQSIDSRLWGPLPLKNVLAIVLLKLPHPVPATSVHRSILGCGLPAGQIAPSFSAQALSGETITLKHYRGQNIFFLFIAATELIRKYMPSYLSLASGAAARQIQVVLVSSTDRHGTRAFIEELQISLPVLIAPADTSAFLRAYHISSVPSYCFINAEGNVQASGRANDSLPAWKEFVEAWSSASDRDIPAADRSPGA